MNASSGKLLNGQRTQVVLWVQARIGWFVGKRAESFLVLENGKLWISM